MRSPPSYWTPSDSFYSIVRTLGRRKRKKSAFFDRKSEEDGIPIAHAVLLSRETGLFAPENATRWGRVIEDRGASSAVP